MNPTTMLTSLISMLQKMQDYLEADYFKVSRPSTWLAYAGVLCLGVYVLGAIGWYGLFGFVGILLLIVHAQMKEREEQDEPSLAEVAQKSQEMAMEKRPKIGNQIDRSFIAHAMVTLPTSDGHDRVKLSSVEHGDVLIFNDFDLQEGRVAGAIIVPHRRYRVYKNEASGTGLCIYLNTIGVRDDSSPIYWLEAEAGEDGERYIRGAIAYIKAKSVETTKENMTE